MRGPRGLGFLALLLLLLELLPRPGDGNEGSVAGSCYCGKTFSSPPRHQHLAGLRKRLQAYHRCNNYIRFQVRGGSGGVCGGSKDRWVQELMDCFDRRECGHVDSGSAAPRQHLPPPSTQVRKPTETAPLDLGSPAQTHLPPAPRSTQAPTLPAGAPSSNLSPASWSTQVPTLPAGAPSSNPPAARSTQAPTLPAGAPSLDEELTQAGETATSTVGHGEGAESEAGEKQKQLEGTVGATSGTSATVPVASLLAITFALTGVLLYFLCRRKKKCLQHSPGLQLQYAAVASDSNA